MFKLKWLLESITYTSLLFYIPLKSSKSFFLNVIKTLDNQPILQKGFNRKLDLAKLS